MVRAVRRQWRYMTTWLRRKQDERADPEVQLEQAIEEARRQHQLLQQQAAAVLSNQHQLQIQLGRAIDDVEKLKQSTAQALRLSESSRAAGDEPKAVEYEQTARVFAAQLASSEQQMESLKDLHDKALLAADNAKRAVQQNRMLLQDKMAERSKLMTQLEQARMQERMNSAMQSMTATIDGPSGDTPTMDEVRQKIEQRYARALGSAELSSTSIDARMLEVQQSLLQTKGDTRLEEIRRTLHLEGPAVTVEEPRGITGGAAPPLTEGQAPTRQPARRRSRRSGSSESG